MGLLYREKVSCLLVICVVGSFEELRVQCMKTHENTHNYDMRMS